MSARHTPAAPPLSAAAVGVVDHGFRPGAGLARAVAVVGASGFMGTALVPALQRAGFAVRRLARRPAELEDISGVEDHAVDLGDEDVASLRTALRGVDTAFYLVHAMGGGAGFAERDRRYAARFADVARVVGVRHVVYLGGLFPQHTELSEHLRSRREVGDILRRRCGALHVRAGIVIGPGSASFLIMRDLVGRLPVMLTPRWVRNRCQPVDVRDAVAALVGAVDVPGNREVDMAGPEVLSYGAMLERLAVAMGRRRPLIVGVPVLTPGLSARWLRFITSVSLPVARALVESLRHDAVSTGDDLFAELGLQPRGYDEAVRGAVQPADAVINVDVERSWDGPRYSLRQRFALAPGTRVNRSLLESVDAMLHDLTRSVMLRTLRWDGEDLRLGRWSLMRLGAPRWNGSAPGTVARSILGGALTASAGGELVVRGWEREGRPGVEVQIVGYTPRLRSLLYLRIQEPLHRALVGRAVRAALRRQQGAARGREVAA